MVTNEELIEKSIVTSPSHAPIDPEPLAKVTQSMADKLSILQDFMDQSQSDYLELKEALERQDFSVCKRVAHRMKGASRMVGAYNMATICEKIENNVRQQTSEGMDAVLTELRSELEKISRYITQMEF